ncbi:MAG: acetate/propionate family kinase [Alphaproteobacteria bacterium]|nr:acetate/propionate family kinase [Alphaproteobacteria bacterium]
MRAGEAILVANAGSSSLKFEAFAAGPDGGIASIGGGQFEGLGTAPRLHAVASGRTIAARDWGADGFDHAAAVRELGAIEGELLGGRRLAAIGHRVVHGGMRFAEPLLVDEEAIAALQALVTLAPLHQPHNLAPIRAYRAARPGVPQVACFDTAFHRAQPAIAQSFALPGRFAQDGVRRYGFHGLSYEYIARRLPELDASLADARVVVAHLGNGASLCAMRGGRSVASTMGFTALDGLVMGTRCGSLDPGVVLHLMDRYAMGPREIEALLYRQSGLLGVSGISSDMRVLRASPDPRAREAIDLFVYRAVREIGSLAAALGGLDALVFTAGIGENDAATRREIAAACAWLGVRIDEAANAAGGPRLSPPGAAVSAWAVETDEEQMIALHTVAALRLA